MHQVAGVKGTQFKAPVFVQIVKVPRADTDLTIAIVVESGSNGLLITNFISLGLHLSLEPSLQLLVLTLIGRAGLAHKSIDQF